MPPPNRKNKIKKRTLPCRIGTGVRFFYCFVCIKPGVPRPPYEGTARVRSAILRGESPLRKRRSRRCRIVGRAPPAVRRYDKGANGNSAWRISPPEKAQSSMQNRRACPARRTRVRQGVRSAILRGESAFYFMGTTSTESLRVHIPSVKSGIACACPPAAIDASESAVMHIHAAAS